MKVPSGFPFCKIKLLHWYQRSFWVSQPATKGVLSTAVDFTLLRSDFQEHTRRPFPLSSYKARALRGVYSPGALTHPLQHCYRRLALLGFTLEVSTICKYPQVPQREVICDTVEGQNWVRYLLARKNEQGGHELGTEPRVHTRGKCPPLWTCL